MLALSALYMILVAYTQLALDLETQRMKSNSRKLRISNRTSLMVSHGLNAAVKHVNEHCDDFSALLKLTASDLGLGDSGVSAFDSSDSVDVRKQHYSIVFINRCYLQRSNPRIA